MDEPEKWVDARNKARERERQCTSIAPQRSQFYLTACIIDNNNIIVGPAAEIRKSKVSKVKLSRNRPWRPIGL
jgi:hypothetical protein